MLDSPTSKTEAKVAADRVRQVLDDLGYAGEWQWSFHCYIKVLKTMTEKLNLRRHLEVGAGRNPSLTVQEAELLNCTVALNDISESELSRGDSSRTKITCDIASPRFPELLGDQRYDFAYSCMVMEHVEDVPGMWKNLATALEPGGVALCHFPTLYAPPLVLNLLMPEWLSSFLLKAVFPERSEDGLRPKFPALYNFCTSREHKIGPMLEQVGFSEYVVLPFWGYDYFDKFPGIKQVDHAFTRLAHKRRWRIFSSYAYVIAIR